jgi:hypothetical protein
LYKVISAELSKINSSYPAQARDQVRKLSIVFLTVFGLNKTWPEASSIVVSIMFVGSLDGMKSIKLTNSPAFASEIVFLDTLAPLASEIAGSEDADPQQPDVPGTVDPHAPGWAGRDAPTVDAALPEVACDGNASGRTGWLPSMARALDIKVDTLLVNSQADEPIL